MHDVRSQLEKPRPELEKCSEVAMRGEGARRVPKCDMVDAGPLEISDVAPGRRGRDDLVARISEGAELRTKQQFETHVGRSHVDNSRSYSADAGHSRRPA